MAIVTPNPPFNRRAQRRRRWASRRPVNGNTLDFSMTNRATHTLGWLTVTLSLIIGLLGAAPFTPAIFLVTFLLPAAALVAWRGAVVAGLLSLLLCTVAFAISPLPVAQLDTWPLALAWLVIGWVAVVLGAVHGIRTNGTRHAVKSATETPNPALNRGGATAHRP